MPANLISKDENICLHFSQLSSLNSIATDIQDAL